MERSFHPWQGVPYVWDDCRVPASGIDPVGLAAPPTRDADTGLLMFSGTLDNIVAADTELPHDWVRGTAIYPHMHLRFTTAASGVDTRWLFEYDIADTDGEFTNAFGTYSSLTAITVANPDNAKKNVTAAFEPLTMTGYGLSVCITWRLSRLASSDAADNDTNSCGLVAFDFHYLKNGTGGSPSQWE